METVSITLFYDAAVFAIYLFSLIGKGLCLAYFLQEFLKHKHFSRGFASFLTILIYVSFCLVSRQAMPEEERLLSVLGQVCFSCLAIWLIIRLLYIGVPRLTAFLIVCFTAISQLSLFISYTLLYFGGNITHLWLWFLEKDRFTSLNSFMLTVEVSLNLLLFFQVMVQLFLLFFSLKRISKDFVHKDVIRQTEERFLLFPALTGLLLCMMLRMIIISAEDSLLLYQEYPFLAILVPIIMLFSLFSILSGVKLFQDMLSLQKEKNSRIILEQQIHTLQKQTQEMERLYSGIRGLKHDMKNTLSVVMQLSRKKQMDAALNQELETYLARLKTDMDAFDTDFHTGNRVVDTLLKMKQYEIGCWNTKLTIEAEGLLFPDGLNIESYDLAIILGNALDNAMEACCRLAQNRLEAKLFIRLSSFCKNNLFFLEISNSFDEILNTGSSQEFPLTLKPDKTIHGIGLKNIKATALKYDGEADWMADGSVFCLTVMMKAKPNV